MSSIENKPFMYPNVTQVPGQSQVGEGKPAKGDEVKKGEFDKVFDQALGQPISAPQVEGKANLGQLKEPLKISAHAAQRLRDRKITLDPQTLAKVGDAVDKADAKGVQDTLVLTKDAALIVSVKNRTVITAMDRSALNGNVFTNIDGAVIV